MTMIPPRHAAALAPIAVFDSGIGGISVLQEIRRLLPAEDLLYIADTAHCPYGVKPYPYIQQRARAIVSMAVERGAKAVVVACNTASVAALNLLRQEFDLPIVGMEPAVKPAAAATRSGVIGVLATGATLGGERFANLVERFANGVELITQPCPGLVEQVEAGDLDGPRTVELLLSYINPLLERGADTLVLGCTHYPFLRSTIAALVGPSVTIIDTGAAVARQTRRVLEERQLLAPANKAGSELFFTSGDPAAVGPVASTLWGAPADVAHAAI